MQRSQIMGIVNINDDSFSNDGTLDPVEALLQAQKQILAGADMIDIGAESARTNRVPISIDEEISRLLGFINGWPELLAATGSGRDIRLSVNTWRPEVLEGVLPTRHINIVNDISGLPDARNAELAAKHQAALLIMHSVGEPKIPHTHQLYDDIWATMLSFFEEKIQLAKIAGLSSEDIILDPGIDFAKQRDDNLAIYREISRLHAFGHQILLPVSRKTVIGEVLDLPDPSTRDAGTIACIAHAEAHGNHIYRVHNVAAASQALEVLNAIKSSDSYDA